MDSNFRNISPWLDKLPFKWDVFYDHGSLNTFNKHEHIYHYGDSLDDVYIVLSGRVRLYLMTDEGKEKTVAIIGENGLLGESILSTTNYYFTSAITVSNKLKLLKVNKNTFEKIAYSDQTIVKQWLEMLSRKVELLTNSTLNLSFENSLIRLGNVFLHLAEMYGKQDSDDSVTITISFTHQELADLIGTTRVIVVNSLKNLMRLELLEKDGRFYRVISVTKLKDFVDSVITK